MECLIYALSEGMKLVILKRSCLPILNKKRASWDVGLSVPFFCGITPVGNRIGMKLMPLINKGVL